MKMEEGESLGVAGLSERMANFDASEMLRKFQDASVSKGTLSEMLPEVCGFICVVALIAISIRIAYKSIGICAYEESVKVGVDKDLARLSATLKQYRNRKCAP